jgi:2-haloacid dehalogenase
MKLTDFQAISFDCYGTLIDWEAGLSGVLVPWARARGLHLSEQQLLAEYSSVEATVEAEHPSDLPRRPGTRHAASRRQASRVG